MIWVGLGHIFYNIRNHVSNPEDPLGLSKQALRIKPADFPMTSVTCVKIMGREQIYMVNVGVHVFKVNFRYIATEA